MKTKSRIIIFTIFIFIISHVSAQDTLNYATEFPSGIFISYGLGSYSVKDEYISKEKYSGTLPYFNVEWVRFHEKHAYCLEFEYRSSSEISNNNISAKVEQFTFNQDFIYSIGSFSIFSKRMSSFCTLSVIISGPTQK